jgi:hypothetical protein
LRSFLPTTQGNNCHEDTAGGEIHAAASSGGQLLEFDDMNSYFTTCKPAEAARAAGRVVPVTAQTACFIAASYKRSHRRQRWRLSLPV